MGRSKQDYSDCEDDTFVKEKRSKKREQGCGCGKCNDKYRPDGDKKCKKEKKCFPYPFPPTPPPLPPVAQNVPFSLFSGPAVLADTVIPSGGTVPLGFTSNLANGVVVNPGGGLLFTILTPGTYAVKAHVPLTGGVGGGFVTFAVNSVPQPQFGVVVPSAPAVADIQLSAIVVAAVGTTVSVVNIGNTSVTIPQVVAGVQTYSGIRFIKLA